MHSSCCRASLVPVEIVVSGLWYTSLAIHTAALKQPAAMQQDPQDVDAGLRRTIEHGVQTLLSADSWYRSCVELIVPSLLHMGAVGAINAERYRSAAGEWFKRLEHVVMTRLNAQQGELGRLSDCTGGSTSDMT